MCQALCKHSTYSNSFTTTLWDKYYYIIPILKGVKTTQLIISLNDIFIYF